MSKKLWGGRFKKKTHPRFDAFSSSLPVDHKLAPYDLRASEIHCALLKRAGLIPAAAAGRITKALRKIGRNLAGYRTAFSGTGYEDIHSLIEAELVRLAGKDAKMIHAGRSRNDQVNVATRLYCKDRGANVVANITGMQTALIGCARRHANVVLAGMTHLQKAQPVLVAHVFLSYVEALERSKARLADALGRADVLTLGSGAMSGSLIPLDRKWAAKQLGFAEVGRNSIDAVGGRDFVAEIGCALALLGTDLSRIAEDLLIGQMEPNGYYQIPEELCTGSSMMPQKRNPDFLELARGASAILAGNASALLTLLKGMPGSYNRDLQWDKGPLFQSTEISEELTALFTVLFRGLRVNRRRAEASLQGGELCATDVADRLAMKGMSFRDAHEKVGQLIAVCEEQGTSLGNAREADARRLLGISAKTLSRWCDPHKSVELKKNAGSTGAGPVADEIKNWEKRIRASI